MNFDNPAPLSVTMMVFNLMLALFLSVLLAIYYAKLGDSLSNRSKFAPILPLLTLITLLVISVVKSSLALSLGLVGALSIVRFRTAIKDPEELIFLFFAISIGLGLGADQRIPTLVAFLIIMSYLLIRKILNKSFKWTPHNNLYLNINLPQEESADAIFQFINNTLGDLLKKVDLRRFDADGTEIRMVFYFKENSVEKLMQLISQIQDKYPSAQVSVIEQNNILGG
ncbi:MAG: DUF4956 domain-containing protein [Chloroflexi bacterium]|nr:DUF4956 domain-containing protein [Chloroflexota bacterium]